ncbi:MAG: AzlD domain-containing protein [Chloroflexi bacterium]|nr:AzlD domain-containing protein [Chloroflexota bacterium]
MEIVLIGGMALVTYLIRYPVMSLVGRVQLPERFIQALKYVPVAVLTAIIAPAMLLPQGRLDLSLTNASLLGGIAAIGIAALTKNLLITIVGGLLIFFLLQALLV